MCYLSSKWKCYLADSIHAARDTAASRRDGVYSRWMVACGAQPGRHHCRHSELLQCYQLPSCLAQDCTWPAEVVAQVAEDCPGKCHCVTVPMSVWVMMTNKYLLYVVSYIYIYTKIKQPNIYKYICLWFFIFLRIFLGTCIVFIKSNSIRYFFITLLDVNKL